MLGHMLCWGSHYCGELLLGTECNKRFPVLCGYGVLCVVYGSPSVLGLAKRRPMQKY